MHAMKPRVLVVSADRARPWDRIGTVAEVTVTANADSPEISRKIYDGVVVALDGESQLDRLERVREVAGDTPIVVLSPDDGSDFLEAARRHGADAVFKDGGPSERMAAIVLQAIATIRQSVQSRGLSEQSRGHWADIRRISRENRALVRRAQGLMSAADPYPILVAEDDDNCRVLLERGFRQAGLPAFRRVQDGLEAVRYLDGNGEFADRAAFPLPSLLILDYHMPRLNGLEVLRWMKRQSELRGIPVLLLSFSEEPEVIAEATNAGANAYLVKPLTIQQWTRIAEVVRGYRDLALSAS